MKNSLCLAMILSWAAIAQAATSTGSITGTLFDSIGDPIDNNAVQAKSSESGTVFKATTSATGKYTIADIAVFPWYGGLVKGWSYDAAEFLQVQDYKHVQRWADTILERPAVRRGRMVNRVRGEPSSQLHERHDASDFETKTQDKLTAVK